VATAIRISDPGRTGECVGGLAVMGSEMDAAFLEQRDGGTKVPKLPQNLQLSSGPSGLSMFFKRLTENSENL